MFNTPHGRLGQEDVDHQHDTDLGPLGIDWGEPHHWRLSANHLERDVCKERTDGPPEAVAHQETAADPGRSTFRDVDWQSGLQAADTDAGQELGHEPDRPTPGEGFGHDAAGENQPVGVHGWLPAQSARQEGNGDHAQDLAHRHDGAPTS